MTSGAEDRSYTAHVIKQTDRQTDRQTSSHLRYNVELAATLLIPTVVGTRDDCIDPTSLCLYC